MEAYDFLPRDWAAYFAQAYAGEKSLAEVNPNSNPTLTLTLILTLAEVSPCNVSLAGFPPLLIEYGECECLRDQISVFVENARAAGIEAEHPNPNPHPVPWDTRSSTLGASRRVCL